MFEPFDHVDQDLDAAIASAFSDLRTHPADSDEYSKVARQLSGLYRIRHENAQLNLQAQRESANHNLSIDQHSLARDQHQLANDIRVHEDELDERPFYARVDPNTALTVLGNIVIGIAVIKYEQTGVISSKVFSFMRKI